MVRLFTKPGCLDCEVAEARLKEAGFEFEVVLCETMAD